MTNLPRIAEAEDEYIPVVNAI